MSRLRLSCCSYCQNWFQKLSQHVSQCKKRSAIVNGLTSSQQHSSSSQCQSVAPMPTQGSMSSSAPLPRNDYQTPASDETSGWQFIMGLSIDDILKMTPPQTVKCIKPKLKSQFQDCCLIPLQRIRENPMDDEAWKLLFLLPRMILCPLSRGGKSKIKDIHCIYDKFLNFQWAELVHTPAQTDTRKGRFQRANSKRTALNLIKLGEISRAARALTSPGLAPESEETAAKLAEKHPKRSCAMDDIPQPTKESITLSKYHFLKVIKKHPRGSANGPSGWRFEHIRALLDHPSTANDLYFACSSIARGAIPHGAAKLLSAARLVALPKGQGDVRPIAIGDALRRITAQTICSQMRETFSEFFTPLQHGVATSGGSELLVNHIRFLLESNSEWSVLKTDVKNAFNSIQRSSLLKSISSSFPSLYNHVYQMYSTDSSLIYQNGKTLHIIPSEEGVHQGDPLGPFLFSIAIHQSLGETQSQNPEVRCLAYLDDIFMVGQSDHVFSTFVDLKSNFNTLGLQIQDKKCEVFCPPPALNQDMSPWRGILVSQAGMMVLGSPIGTDDFIKRSCIEIAESGHHLCNELTTLDDPQSAMLLLRYSHRRSRKIEDVRFRCDSTSQDLPSTKLFLW